MVKLDAAKADIISQLLINLGSGWYAATLILPNISYSNTEAALLALITNFCFGTLSLVMALKFKRLGQFL